MKTARTAFFVLVLICLSNSAVEAQEPAEATAQTAPSAPTKQGDEITKPGDETEPREDLRALTGLAREIESNSEPGYRLT